MKPQRAIFKWIAMAIVLAMFLSFANISPSAFAQEGNPPTAIETPTEIFPEGTFFPTIMPTPTMEESPLPSQLQNEEQPSDSFQSLEQLIAPLNPEWPAVNMSDTEIDSADSSIATDSTGKIHIAWVERETNGTSEIYYTFWDGERLSTPINVSASETFGSTTPQIVADSDGKAHIVGQDQDSNGADHYETLYSSCENIGDETDSDVFLLPCDLEA